jgi:hypothetical protein
MLHRLVGIGVFLLVLVLFIKTMAPSVSFWDTGEFIACSYILGVPHPPGAPLYILLGRVFTLLPISEVAWRVVFMSVLTSAGAIWCTYLSSVVLIRRSLGGHALRPFGDNRDISVITGAVVAALSLAFSYTFWFNATEAEVYGYSILFACLGFWLVLYWDGTQHGSSNDRWLYLLAYLFGLGGGIHLLCLLTVPALLILAWFADKELRRLVLIGVGGGLVGLAYISLFAEYPPSAKFIGLLSLLALAVLLVYSWRLREELQPTVKILAGLGAATLCMGLLSVGAVPQFVTLSKIIPVAGAVLIVRELYLRDRRALSLSLGLGILFCLGYSTYIALLIRSGLDPAIDENDPETWAAFMSFLNREQYGTDSMLLQILAPRASRVYQIWDQQFKYFFQQFPFQLGTFWAQFRWATENVPHFISISVFPYLLGLFGLIWHAVRDVRRFLAIAALFVVMGFGLSLYLNMPDPQPRERHYVFGGMFFAFALWMGLGWGGVVELIRERFASLRGPTLVAVACVGLLLPLGIAIEGYHIQDRTDDYIAYDYGHNLLESCEPNSILFTNGDNDTFPLWFLQEVEGVRTDVRVVNLSLLNTNWYIKQLRDREPKIHIPLADDYIDSTLTGVETEDLRARLWLEPRTPKEYADLGLDVELSAGPGNQLLRVQDLMVVAIIAFNAFDRPIHFAITVAGSNRTGLDPFLKMVGMTMKLMPERVTSSAVEPLATNLLEKYRFRGVNDPTIHKDVNTARLLGNYRACLMSLADAYQAEGRKEELAGLFEWAIDTIPLSWEGYYSASDYHRDIGETEKAAEYLETAGTELVKVYGLHPSATYDNVLAIASMLLNIYRDYERAEHIYRLAIAEQPHRYDGYHELAATMQAGNDPQRALDLVEEFMARYGKLDTAEADKMILLNAIRKRTAPPAGDLPQGDPPADSTGTQP